MVSDGLLILNLEVFVVTEFASLFGKVKGRFCCPENTNYLFDPSHHFINRLA